MTKRFFSIFFGLFLFVLPIPGTIALRQVLLLGLLALLVLLWHQSRKRLSIPVRGVGALLLWLAILSAWLIIQACWISEESPWALDELGSQWLPALLAAAVGIGVVLVHADGLSRKKLLAGIVLVFLAQTVFSLLVTLPDFLANGAFPQGTTTLTAGKLELSYWNNLLLSFLVIDVLARWLYRQSLSALPTPLIVGGIFAVFVSNLAFGARNGVIGSILLLSSLALLVIWHERKKIGSAKAVAFLGGAVLLVSTLASLNYHLDPRWSRFTETARIAWNPAASDAWLHPDDALLPQLASGVPVEASAYFRIAWIRAGVDLVADYPWGVGYGRNAFGHALRKTMETRLGHAHSGLIDWTIGVGIPGLILWLAFMIWAAALGIRRYFVAHDPAGLVLTFVVGGFFGRMLLDSINRDHMLMVFFLIVAVLVALPEEPVK
jgi:hypothetical protein